MDRAREGGGCQYETADNMVVVKESYWKIIELESKPIPIRISNNKTFAVCTACCRSMTSFVQGIGTELSE